MLKHLSLVIYLSTTVLISSEKTITKRPILRSFLRGYCVVKTSLAEYVVLKKHCLEEKEFLKNALKAEKVSKKIFLNAYIDLYSRKIKCKYETVTPVLKEIKVQVDSEKAHRNRRA